MPMDERHLREIESRLSENYAASLRLDIIADVRALVEEVQRHRHPPEVTPVEDPGPLCACGHPVSKHDYSPLCRCGHSRPSHHDAAKNGISGCGQRICRCTSYEPHGDPVYSYCLGVEGRVPCGCIRVRLHGRPVVVDSRNG